MSDLVTQHSPGLLPTPLRGRTEALVPVQQNRAWALSVVLFGTTMFTASALLFMVQPMFARIVLPRLGGSPSVWNACVLFFQSMLLLGYLYAHLSTRWLGVRRQSAWHTLVLLVPMLFLPLSAGSGTPAGTQSPVWWLLATLAATVGVPFFVLATTAPLLQRWFAVMPVASAKDPYFLYAASNLGSMLALLAYPFAIEPAIGLANQAQVWTAAYVLFVSLAVASVLVVQRLAREGRALPPTDVEFDAVPLAGAQRLRWVALAFAPSSLMLGVTVHISTDVAAVPLLWVVPLALYLLTFVLAFSQRDSSRRGWWHSLAPALIVGSLITIALNAHAWWFIPLHLATFFGCAMVCHSALSASRPHVAHLTEFYLWISFGGMLGGIFNTVSPFVFSTVFEYPLMLATICWLVPACRARGRSSHVLAGYVVLVAGVVALGVAELSAQAARALVAAIFGIAASLAAAQGPAVLRVLSVPLVVVIGIGRPLSGGMPLLTERSFFGVARVVEAKDGGHRVLRHGSTVHGWQRLPDEGRCEPSSYYHPTGPVGDIMRTFGPRVENVGVVGLGTGAMACYAAPGQHWTFYEIDPLMERIARDESLFTHLRNAAVNVEVIIGDGRVKLHEAAGNRFDLLVLDAFSSDSIPVHLLTREALDLYVSRLTLEGILAVHISNRYLALEPVVAALAQRAGMFAAVRHDAGLSPSEQSEGKAVAAWVVVSGNQALLRDLAQLPGWRGAVAQAGTPVWTDDYSNLVRALR